MPTSQIAGMCVPAVKLQPAGTPVPPVHGVPVSIIVWPVPAAELDEAERTLDLESLIRSAVESQSLERYRYTSGRVEQVESFKSATA